MQKQFHPHVGSIGDSHNVHDNYGKLETKKNIYMYFNEVMVRDATVEASAPSTVQSNAVKYTEGAKGKNNG